MLLYAQHEGKNQRGPTGKIHAFVEGNPAGKGLVKFEDNTFWNFSNELDEQGKKFNYRILNSFLNYYFHVDAQSDIKQRFLPFSYEWHKYKI